jgi:hypothetical protein
MYLKGAQRPPDDASKRLLVKHKTIRVLLDTGSSGDLLFLEKGSNMYIPVVCVCVCVCVTETLARDGCLQY